MDRRGFLAAAAAACVASLPPPKPITYTRSVYVPVMIDAGNAVAVRYDRVAEVRTAASWEGVARACGRLRPIAGLVGLR